MESVSLVGLEPTTFELEVQSATIAPQRLSIDSGFF